MDEVMDEVLINNKTYIIGKLNARKQLHVFRRLAGVFIDFIMNYKSGSIMENIQNIKDIKLIIDALAKLDDATLDYVIDHCCAVVKYRDENGHLFPIMASNGRFQYEEDLSMMDLMQIVAEVVKANLKNFTNTDRQTSNP